MENNIKEAFDKVLEVGNLTDETKDNKLSDSQIVEISETLNKVVEENANLKVIADLPSNNGVSENENIIEGEDVLVNVKINPVTNEKVVIGTVEEDDDEDLSLELFNDILNDEAEGTNIDDVEFRQDTVETAIKEKFNTSFSNNDIIKFMNVLNEYRKDKTINVYAKLPDKIKSLIDRAAADKGIPYNALTNVRKMASRELMEDMIFDLSIDNYQIEFTKGINSVFDDMNKEIKDMSINITKNQIEKLTELEPEMREKDPKLADRLLLVIDGMKNSFSFERLYNAIKDKKIGKIRKIDLEKPQKIYNNFNRLYEKSVYNIYDINMIPNVLRKKLSNDISDEAIHKFVISFCKYCENEKLKPDVLEEHSFMYYTILNIVLMNIGNKSEEEDKFEEEIIANLTKVIELFN